MLVSKVPIFRARRMISSLSKPISGRSTGRVQTASVTPRAVIDLPVLQPLIGMDKGEIVAWARKIGTFDTSILPYEDCCTVFTPRHPELRPTAAKAEAAEAALDVDALVEEAVRGAEHIKLEVLK